MTNDKLPEDFNMPSNVFEIISKEVYDYYNRKLALNLRVCYSHVKTDYVAGATAWAPWKVKYDELQAEYEKLNNRCHELMAENHLLSESKDDYAAQRMADALEELSESSCDYEITNFAKALHSPECRACNARELLQQFKDGNGKEVENG